MPDDNLDELADSDQFERSDSNYISPILRTLDNTRLTVELLQESIPIMRAGEAAQETLDASKNLNDAKRRALRKAVRDGEKAKEQLFNSALPLIKAIAKKEYNRRQQWGSQILMDDLIQDATIGFFKGLRIFDVSEIKKSATNYLGQWMLSEMRRAAEGMDNDLQVGHDAGERYRRIRAIRSRLAGELGREPTDQEIVTASKDPAYVVRPGMVGKAKNADGHSIRGLTLSQIKDEREHYERLGTVSRFDNADTDDENGTSKGSNTIQTDRTDINSDENSIADDPASVIENSENVVIISDIVLRVIEALSLPEQQREIIARRYGLNPYDEEQSARSISRSMNIHREKISRVLSAFASELVMPAGTLHQILKDFTSEELHDLGLGWLADSLGPWNPDFDISPHKPSPELTRSISVRKNAN
jgi:RNA polymerase sigma factor (sigma-70 family)